MSDFSVTSELEVEVSSSSLRDARDQIERELGGFEVAGELTGSTGTGGGSLADVTGHLEESNRLLETQNDLMRELLERGGLAGGSPGGGVASGGAPGGGPGGVTGLLGIRQLLPAALPTAGVATSGGLLGSLGATAGATAAAGLALPATALAGILSDDSNANPGGLQTSPTDTNVTTPNAEVSQELERLLVEGLDLNRPSWLGSDGTINVQQELVRTTTQSGAGPTAGGSQAGGSPGGSTPPLTVVGGPGSVDTSGSSPGGSTPPLSDVGGPAATGNEAADRRREQQTPPRRVDVSAEVTVDSLADLGREFEDFVEQKLSEIEDGFR